MLIQCAVKYHQKRRLHEMEIRNKKIKGEARQLEGHGAAGWESEEARKKLLVQVMSLLDEAGGKVTSSADTSVQVAQRLAHDMEAKCKIQP